MIDLSMTPVAHSMLDNEKTGETKTYFLMPSPTVLSKDPNLLPLDSDGDRK